ncbi:sensor histidine kinase [Terrimonas ferruginea]|uniref:sensor histidine kinase n=1 Tax=Terrimonas ferruginea TaxID=249 RepID=UPI00041FD962|nr:histidine kinase [Terrimonas ferruginea]
MNIGFWQYLIIIHAAIALALSGMFLLANFKQLFRKSIRNEWLRANISAWLIIFCFIMALLPLNGSLFEAIGEYGVGVALLGQAILVTLNTLIVFNSVRWVVRHPRFQQWSFAKHQALILVTLIVTAVITSLLFYIATAERENIHNWQSTVLISLYFATGVGLVHVFSAYVSLERQKRMDEQSLELSRLREAKATAELEALQAKINPHFLYNALGAIADLSLTDGLRAREMTLALADLFRYSLNYAGDNYATVEEELQLSSLYLRIEQIRFENKLQYEVHTDAEAGTFRVPRFLLQPLLENAVKHGLKATDRLTSIRIDITALEEGISIAVGDNGPPFPEELVPRYGLQSVFDKLDLLFPNRYEVLFLAQPKAVVIKMYTPKARRHV